MVFSFRTVWGDDGCLLWWLLGGRGKRGGRLKRGGGEMGPGSRVSQPSCCGEEPVEESK